MINAMRSETVSIYLPTRNRAALISRAIQSVLLQSHQQIELIVVDDCSDDNTAAIVQNWIKDNKTEKHIEYFRQDRQSGASAARNLAISKASGALITGLDDDDYFLPDRISTLVAAFDPDACSFVFDGYVQETSLPDGHVRRTSVPLKQSAQLQALLKRNIVGNQILTLTSRMRDVGGFDVGLPAWEDYDLWLRLVKTFGVGKPVGGVSYVHTIDATRTRISDDAAKANRAFDIFLEKHTEYADKNLHLCLRLAKVCYDINALEFSDVPRLARLGEPRYVLFALYDYFNYWWSRKALR